MVKIMGGVWWLVLALACVVAYTMMRMFSKAVDRNKRDTALLKFWAKPEPGDDLPANAIKFMQITKSCPFCHTELLAGPRGGVTQNFFCSNVVCNSRFNIMPLPPDHPHSFPFGQFMGPCTEDQLAEIQVLRTSRIIADDANRWSSE